MVVLSTLFFVFNLMFMGCGLAIGGVGIWTVTDPTALQTYINLPNDQLLIVSYVAVVIGAMLILIGFMGCCAALMSNPCLMCLFSVLLTLILLAAAAVGIIAYVATKNETFANEIKNILFAQMEKTKALDALQKHLECCGVNSYEDYKEEPPQSCRDEMGATYAEGCWEKIKETLEKKVHVLAGMTGTLAVLGIITIVLSVLMIGSMKATKVV